METLEIVAELLRISRLADREEAQLTVRDLEQLATELKRECYLFPKEATHGR